MMTTSAYGRLGKEPKSIATASGNTMASASIAVDVSHKGDTDATHWLRLLAFGQTAEVLLRHGHGECIAVMGRMQANNWTDKDGIAHEDLQMIVESLVSARTTRPGAAKARSLTQP